MGLLNVCLFVVGFILVCLAGLLYYASVTVPPGLKKRPVQWLTFTIFNIIHELGCLLSWLGVCDRLTIFKKSITGKPKPPTSESHLSTDVETEDTEFDGVKVRLFTPKAMQNVENRPAIIHYHGGGWVVCSIDTYDAICRKFAYDVGALLISVEYRLAPAHPFPAGLDDCVTASKYFLTNTDRFNVDPEKVVIMGDSAGGNLAPAVALVLRDDKFSPSPKAQVLINPVTQGVDLKLPSYQQNSRGPILTQGMMAAFISQYALGEQGCRHDVWQRFVQNKHVTAEVRKKMANTKLKHYDLPENIFASAGSKAQVSGGTTTENSDDAEDRALWERVTSIVTDQRFSPLLADDFTSLPSTLVFTGQYDPLRDEGILFVQRLQAAGNDVTWQHNKGPGYHGMINSLSILSQPECNKAYQLIIEYIKNKIITS